MSIPCDVEFGLRHELSVLYIAGEYDKMHDQRKRLSRHRHTCPMCNGGMGLHRQLWGAGVMVLAGPEGEV